MFGLASKPVQASKWASFSSVFFASFEEIRLFSQGLGQTIFEVKGSMLVVSKVAGLNVAVEQGYSVLP